MLGQLLMAALLAPAATAAAAALQAVPEAHIVLLYPTQPLSSLT
jgi:hypothetical protein